MKEMILFLFFKILKIKKNRWAAISNHMLFVCKVRNSCLLYIVRNRVDKKVTHSHN